MRTLIINDIDISTYGATLLTVDYGYSKVTTYKDWLKGTKNPLFYGQDTQYTTAELKILVEAANRKELDIASSNLTALARLGKFQVSDADFYIDGDLVDAEDKPISSKAKEITLKVEGIKTQPDTKTFTPGLGEEITFVPIGNCEVSARFEIVMDMGYQSYLFKVNGKSYNISNVTTKDTIIIDGIKGSVTYRGNNKIEDYLAWEFPILKGGKENVIEILGGTLKISYDGRWM